MLKTKAKRICHQQNKRIAEGNTSYRNKMTPDEN